MDGDVDDELLKKAFDCINLAAQSFHDAAIEVATRVNGCLLFNVRVDKDPDFQRIAAIATGRATCIVVLMNDGASLRWCIVDELYSTFLRPLQEWANLPLKDQAGSRFQAYSSLLAGALRNSRRWTPA